jgi:PhnB protein
VTLPVEDKFYGDRYGRVAEPFAHEWQIATHTENLAPDVIAERGKRRWLTPAERQPSLRREVRVRRRNAAQAG